MKIEQIREQVSEIGYCRPFVDGSLYMTLRDCSKERLVKTLDDGWNLAGVFCGKELQLVSEVASLPNRVVFRRKAPAFFTSANPWQDKGPHPWLPNLSTGTSETVAMELANAGGTDCPVIARRFRCRCGSTLVMAHYDQIRGRLDVHCTRCHRIIPLFSSADYAADYDSPFVLIPTLLTSWLRARKQQSPSSDPFQYAHYTAWLGFLRKPARAERLTPYRCTCGNERIALDVGIEYPVNAREGWDFSWLAIAGTCSACQQSAIFFQAETD